MSNGEVLLDQRKICEDNWQRYRYARDRGHRNYIRRARKAERFYLGGGQQWTDAQRLAMEATGRMPLEFNEIKPGVNSALGYQIQNRMDIAFKPRSSEATQETANILNKIVMHIADDVKLHWHESMVFADGLIQERGYFDVRMNFDDNMRGDIEVSVLDPLDVIPDPDAKHYDPKGWNDFIITRFLSADEIEQMYGAKARKKIDEAPLDEDDSDFGVHEDDADEEMEHRNKFGEDELGKGDLFDALSKIDGHTRYRVVERQYTRFELVDVVVEPQTEEVRKIDDLEDADILDELLAAGWIQTKRKMSAVHWVVTTKTIVLHDTRAPYKTVTLVPYFAYFRRGKTAGMVTDAIDPQFALNKSVTQYVHIINTSANSGWVTEEESIANMDVKDFEQQGGATGLHIEMKKGTPKEKWPEKIQPNRVPEGVDRFIDRATAAIKSTTTPDEMRGVGGEDQSGIAIQSRQFASQQQLAVPLDNLSHTRHLLAAKILELIQQFYTDERVFRISEQNPQTGKDETVDIIVNQRDAAGNINNNLILGEYDVVVTEQPMQVTFENSQFEQGLKMKEAGYDIPAPFIIKNSNLADKFEIIQAMSQQGGEPSPELEAKINLMLEQAKKTVAERGKIEAETVNKSIEAIFGASQTARTITMLPAAASVTDELLQSAGFQDRNEPPIVPAITAGPEALPAPSPADDVLPVLPDANTNPITPANPGVGLTDGIEGGEQEVVGP